MRLLSILAFLLVACSGGGSSGSSGAPAGPAPSGSNQARSCVDEATADKLPGNCTGLSTMCSELPAGGDYCEAQKGCKSYYGNLDNPYDDDCSGGAFRCSDFSDWRGCVKQKGCSWVLAGGSAGSAPSDNTLHLCPSGGGTAPSR